jgi:4-amino-4-deoxy-L-arabinose transferase-like glycosyltransferase
MIREKFINFLNKYTEQITILSLCIIFYFIFFHGIGTYSLMDVDETRYVAMSRDMFNTRDFLTLYLNGEYFFEKPPLYFWQECLSFAIFGKINEFTARFPVALLGFLFSFIVYTTSRKRISRSFGVFTSLILATSLEFIILSKYAILDIVLTFYIGLALIVYFQTFFCLERHKKYYWWAFYVFSALAVMAKGIPGFVVPFGTAFFCSLITKRFKENFKPIFLIPGVILFSIIVLPWHIIMFHKYNPLFFNEYIIKHHLHRFLNTAHNEIGRKEPFYYYFVTVLWGFLPWIFSTIAVFAEKLKNIEKFDLFGYIEKFDFEKLDNVHKSLVLCWVAILFIFLFYSMSTTKLITYILPIYYPLALVAGHFWEDYVNKKSHEKSINLSVYIFGGICAVAGFLAIFTKYYLPEQLYNDILEAKWITIICFLAFGIGSILFAKYKKYLGVFVVYVAFMVVMSAFVTDEYFKIDYKFGQQDLIEFAKYAKKKDYTISSFGMERKYSLIYYNDEKADFNTDMEINVKLLEEDLNIEDNVIILKNKDLKKVEGKVKFDIIKKGRRYSMLKTRGK